MEQKSRKSTSVKDYVILVKNWLYFILKYRETNIYEFFMSSLKLVNQLNKSTLTL